MIALQHTFHALQKIHSLASSSICVLSSVLSNSFAYLNYLHSTSMLVLCFGSPAESIGYLTCPIIVFCFFFFQTLCVHLTQLFPPCPSHFLNLHRASRSRDVLGLSQLNFVHSNIHQLNPSLCSESFTIVGPFLNS
jgi:hypothetical protein